MTNNQISYLRHKEDQRAHMANEQYNLASLGETKRHNEAVEGFNLSSLAETIRSNQAREAETHRSNVATESETKRHNQASESIQNITALAEKAYKEATAKLNAEKLDFDKTRENTRIVESLRDFLETVRYHNLSALNSKTVAALVSGLLSTLTKDLDATSNTGGSTNVTVNNSNVDNDASPGTNGGGTTESQKETTKPSKSRGGGISRGGQHGGGISRGPRDGTSLRRNKSKR